MAFDTSVSKTTSGVGTASLRNIRRLFDEAQGLYAPGGEYMKGTEAQLARGQKRSVATGMQNLAASGMAGTSLAGNLGQMYEEDVAQPAMAAANTQRLGALAGLLQSEAGAESQLATRYNTTVSQTPRSSYGGGGGAVPSTPSTRKPAAATAPAKARVPTLSAFPSLSGTGGSGGGYTGVYFGSAYYDKQKAAAAKAKPQPKSTGSFYSDYLSKGGASTGLKGLDPYGIGF